MINPVEGVKPKRARRVAPKLPNPLEVEVQRIAEEIMAARLADARRVAALEVANKLMATAVKLLALAGGGVGLPNLTPSAPIAPKGPTCVLCGQLGIWQDKSAKLAVGTRPPWYCRTHAAGAIHSQREERAGAGLAQALANAAPIDDSSLPA